MVQVLLQNTWTQPDAQLCAIAHLDELGLVELPHAMPQSTRLRQTAARQPVRHLLASGAQPARSVSQSAASAGEHVMTARPAASTRPDTSMSRSRRSPHSGHQPITHTLRHRQRRRTVRTLHNGHPAVRRRGKPVNAPEHPVQPIGQLARGRGTHHTRPRPAHRPIRRPPPFDRQQYPLQIHATSQPKHQTGRLLIHLQPMHTHRQTDRTSTNATTALADMGLAFGERAEFWDGFCEAGDLSAHVFGAVFAEGCLCFGAALLAFVHDGPAFG